MFEEAVLVPIILGLVEAIKRSVSLPGKFSPLLAIGIGLVASLVLNGASIENGIIGLGLGLAAAGLYSGGKAIAKKKGNVEDWTAK